MTVRTLKNIRAAALELHNEQNSNVYITSGSRTTWTQARLFYENCIGPNKDADCGTCNVGSICRKESKEDCSSSNVVWKKSSNDYELIGDLAEETDKNTIITKIASTGWASQCPHTSNVAVDIWCAKGKKPNYRGDTDCMEALGKIMQRHEFCRISNEAWHFEIEDSKISSSCLKRDRTYIARGRVYDPKAGGCDSWWYKNKHKCETVA